MIEMANERVYDCRAEKGRGNETDVDALAAGTEQRQAELAAADYRDDGADKSIPSKNGLTGRHVCRRSSTG